MKKSDGSYKAKFQSKYGETEHINDKVISVIEDELNEDN